MESNIIIGNYDGVFQPENDSDQKVSTPSVFFPSKRKISYNIKLILFSLFYTMMYFFNNRFLAVNGSSSKDFEGAVYDYPMFLILSMFLYSYSDFDKNFGGISVIGSLLGLGVAYGIDNSQVSDSKTKDSLSGSSIVEDSLSVSLSVLALFFVGFTIVVHVSNNTINEYATLIFVIIFVIIVADRFSNTKESFVPNWAIGFISVLLSSGDSYLYQLISGITYSIFLYEWSSHKLTRVVTM